MNSSPPVRSSLLHLLSIVEWVLLGMVAAAQIFAVITRSAPGAILINGLGLAIIAGLGRIDLERRQAEIGRAILEFCLAIVLVFVGRMPLPAVLFIVLALRNCMRLQGWERAISTSLALIYIALSQTQRLFEIGQLAGLPLRQLGPIWIAVLLVSGLVVLFLHLLVEAALKEHRGQVQLADANERLRRYALKVEELAAVQERNRIARELHDALGHSLTAFSIHLEAALRLLESDPERAKALLSELKLLNATALQDVRESVAALRADPLQGRPLAVAIADLVAEFQHSTGIEPEFDIAVKQTLPRELSFAVYRIIQESLTNICKYAAATEVSIAIDRTDRHLKVAIADNGRGFELSQNKTGFGLQGMQERALALAGQLNVVTAPGRGCRVEAILPL